MTEPRPCPGPRVASTPGWRAPPGATDCHCHVFGDPAQYPLSPGRAYTPPPASLESYQAMLATLGIERTVIVQPSIYGTDNACTLDAVAAFGPDRARAVVVVDDTADAASLAAMHARGARGVRFNAVSGNGTPLDQLDALAARIAPLGWHLQLYTHGDALTALAPALAALPVPVVVDHMGGIPAERGTQAAGFRALLRLLDSGRTWVKLCAYRSSHTGAPYADMLPFARTLVEGFPERLVWGTDWPHPSLTDPAMVPDDGQLFDLLGTWTPSVALRRRILVDNPAALYGFPPA